MSHSAAMRNTGSQGKACLIAIDRSKLDPRMYQKCIEVIDCQPPIGAAPTGQHSPPLRSGKGRRARWPHQSKADLYELPS